MHPQGRRTPSPFFVAIMSPLRRMVVMPLIIDDEVLQQAGLSEGEARIEFACRMFDADKLSIHQAAKFAGMGRYELEAELARRNIPVYRYTEEHFRQDLEAIRKLESSNDDRRQRHLANPRAGASRPTSSPPHAVQRSAYSAGGGG